MDNHAHTGVDSSITGMEHTGSLEAAGEITTVEVVMVNGFPTLVEKKVKKPGFNPDLVAAAKRQSFLKENKNNKFDVTAFLNQIQFQVEAMGPSKLEEPFEALRQDDRARGNLGPRGIYSVLVLNTFLDAVEHLRTAALNNPELYRRSELQAFDLLREIAASPDEVLDFAKRHDLELVD